MEDQNHEVTAIPYPNCQSGKCGSWRRQYRSFRLLRLLTPVMNQHIRGGGYILIFLAKSERHFFALMKCESFSLFEEITNAIFLFKLS